MKLFKKINLMKMNHFHLLIYSTRDTRHRLLFALYVVVKVDVG